jgi:hypothetical protein
MEAKGQALRESIAQEEERLSSMDQDLRTQQQQRDNLNIEKQRIRDLYIAAQDANTQTYYENQTRQIENQIRTRQDSIDRLNQSLSLAQSKLQTQHANLRELDAEYKSKSSEYERTFGYVKAKYQPMMNDPEIIQALRQLNRSARPWIMIGPHWEYDKNVRSLAQLVLDKAGLETTYTTVSKRVGRRVTKVKVARVSLAKQEKALREDGYKARVLESKLTGPNGAANRQAMAAAVDRLKKGITEVENGYTNLKKDPLITSAIEQVAPGATLEPTDDFKNYAKRLPDLERTLSATK